MIHIKSFCFGAFMENTFVVHEDSGECLVIDPGCYEPLEQEELVSYVTDQNLKVIGLVNTHCHIDHVLGNQFIKNTYNVPLTIHRDEEPMLKSVASYASNYGFPGYQPAAAEHFLEEGDELEVGNVKLKILLVPGHSPGHIMLYNAEQNICIGGDVLFRNSIGRTDLPGGDHDALIDNIRSKVFSLDDDTTVYCGHGPETTVGYEKANNPFVGEGS